MKNLVILVDEFNKEIGESEKLLAHNKGLLHRAFSIFIFDKHNRMLLQQRAFDKYHSGGLWTNACCSHPKPGEEITQAAHRRLKEEMGFDCELVNAFNFTYKVQFSTDMIEYEYDHVFVGRFDGEVEPNPTEVANFCWKELSLLKQELQQAPNLYSEWFKICVDDAVNFYLTSALSQAAE